MTLLKVGLTGGIASGKSTVGTWLREAGFRVIDSDAIVAALYRPGGAGAQAVAELFGPEYLTSNGAVDHARVARRIFDDEGARRLLEEAIHPLVKREFESIAAESTGIVVLEAPLLIEAGMATAFDLVVTVEAAADIRHERAVARGLDAVDAERRLAAQSPPDIRIEAADVVLRNDGDRAQLRRQVEELIRVLTRRMQVDN